ncbi:hypothetical protein KCU85_g66, partial [Aureobasidium melanogenum]
MLLLGKRDGEVVVVSSFIRVFRVTLQKNSTNLDESPHPDFGIATCVRRGRAKPTQRPVLQIALMKLKRYSGHSLGDAVVGLVGLPFAECVCSKVGLGDSASGLLKALEGHDSRLNQVYPLNPRPRHSSSSLRAPLISSSPTPNLTLPTLSPLLTSKPTIPASANSSAATFIPLNLATLLSFFPATLPLFPGVETPFREGIGWKVSGASFRKVIRVSPNRELILLLSVRSGKSMVFATAKTIRLIEFVGGYGDIEGSYYLSYCGSFACTRSARDMCINLAEFIFTAGKCVCCMRRREHTRVVSLRGAGCLLRDVGVAEVNPRRFRGVAVSPSSSSGATNSSRSPGVVALTVDLRLRVLGSTVDILPDEFISISGRASVAASSTNEDFSMFSSSPVVMYNSFSRKSRLFLFLLTISFSDENHKKEAFIFEQDGISYVAFEIAYLGTNDGLVRCVYPLPGEILSAQFIVRVFSQDTTTLEKLSCWLGS